MNKAETVKNRSWSKFRKHRRGMVSLCLLVILYVVSLFAELLCNDKPIILKTEKGIFFPAYKTYTEDQLWGNGKHTRATDYGTLPQNSWAIYPIHKAGADTIFSAEDLKKHCRAILEVKPLYNSAYAKFSLDNELIFATGNTNALSKELSSIPLEKFADGIAARKENKAHSSIIIENDNATELILPAYSPRSTAPDSYSIIITQNSPIASGIFFFNQSLIDAQNIISKQAFSQYLDKNSSKQIIDALKQTINGHYIAPITITDSDGIPVAKLSFEMESVTWPFRPVSGHPFGFDAAGRDVLARIVYGMRTALTFGIVLVIATMFLGIIAGAIQGYFAGWVDITGQRLTEIWCALPFIYIIILLGNTLGRSFSLLLFCYAIFNWVGTAAYVRAEFLRLRGREFVDAARCQGLSKTRIMFCHILPNALTPLITLLPFALVGAVGSLAMLDYLGFGMPDTAASWGALLQQAQAFRNAWWLILYPSLALFIVMLLGVFIGEGLRDALDPKPYSRME